MVEEAMPFVGRLATALVELTLAGAVICGAIVVGHDLREWRDWYPTVYHPWIGDARLAPKVQDP
jgi:hypothetical protein